MSIETTYRRILTEAYVQDELKKGEIPSAEDIEDKITEIINTMDLTKPQFKADPFKAYPHTSSSALLFNIAQRSILADLRVIYKEMLLLSETSVTSYERWRVETEKLEKQLAALEDRVQNLLLLTKDTEGYKSYIVDNFTDMSLVDRDETTAFVDPVHQGVTIGNDGGVDTRIYISNLNTQTDVSFKVRSTNNFVSRADSRTGSLATIFGQLSIPWSTQISMTKVVPVTCELTVKLGTDPIRMNKIIVQLHQAARASEMTITPMYSLDNFNFKQLPTNTFSQSVRSTATFAFDEIELKYLKFILTKEGNDVVASTDKAVYQFGFKTIEFYAEKFALNAPQTLISQPLSVVSASNPNDRVEFSKLTLEVCERCDASTAIDYFVTVSDDPEVPLDAQTVWIPISPISHASPTQPSVIDVGHIEEQEVGIDETIGISYSAIDNDFQNPADTFHLLSLSNVGALLDEEVSADSLRYVFSNENERLLSYQIKDSDYDGSGTGTALTIDEDNLIIFRNVGEKGLDPDEHADLVRGHPRGWKFLEPYYTTVVEILNPLGITIDFGDKTVYIDEVAYTNKVGSKILTGKTATTTGIHLIKVHKDNWLEITPDLDNLDDIKAEDTLYPFNHKLLVEGYAYPTNYGSGQEKAYTGVDLFASDLMQRVSIFDFGHSVKADQYHFYALDRDGPNTHAAGNEATRLFVVKVDQNNADFQNERFVLRFNLINQRYKYLRLKAIFSTFSKTVAPFLDSYKIKLG